MQVEDKIIQTTLDESRRADIAKMLDTINQYNVTAYEFDGRKLRYSESDWAIDFASCNYLGLDLDPEMSSTISEEIKTWGVHPSWCRLVASPNIYNELEAKIADLVGTEASLIIPTVTLISVGVLPALVGKTGVLLLDKSGHETMYEAAKIARDSGATLESFKQDDFETLEALLQRHQNNDRIVIMVDGVYSMTGDYADMPRLAQLAKKYSALVYIDDAHGFGVVGENPTKVRPYGVKGNGIVRHFGIDYESLIYVGGCSKAYSSLAAFVACSKKMKKFLQGVSTPYDLSGPCPTASLATLSQGLHINKVRGDEIRDTLYRLTTKAVNGLREIGYTVQNKTGFPIILVTIGDNDKLIASANSLLEQGILVTTSPFPMMPKGQEAHRITITAANTTEQVDQLVDAFRFVKEKHQL